MTKETLEKAKVLSNDIDTIEKILGMTGSCIEWEFHLKRIYVDYNEDALVAFPERLKKSVVELLKKELEAYKKELEDL